MKSTLLLLALLMAPSRGKSVGKRRHLPDNEYYTRKRNADRKLKKGKGGTRPTTSTIDSPDDIPTSLPTTEDRDSQPAMEGVIGVPVVPNEPSTDGNPTIQSSPPPIDPTTVSPFQRPQPAPTLAPLSSQPTRRRRCGDDVLQKFPQDQSPFVAREDSFADPDSYQCRALLRVLDQEGFSEFSLATSIKYWVLYCIFFSTNEAVIDNIFEQREIETSWKNTQGWLRNDLDPCDGWFGITCDSIGRVTEILLQRNGLKGIFPPEVSYLAATGRTATGAGNLRRLDIFNNEYLTNDSNSNWISELGGAMQVLNYGSTSFKGTLPRLPSNLVEFDCSYSLHSGPIPSSFFDELNSLKMLILDGNNFGSTIPSEVSTLPKLEIFYAREAGLIGDLHYMKGMPSIVEHLVDGNPDMEGAIYSYIGELRTLRSLSATDCGLAGELPAELGQLTNMVQLWLHGNKISGRIPSEYEKMTQLRILSLEDNDITGVVPIELCLLRFDGALTSLSTDCHDQVDCSGFFPNCCSCCGRDACGTSSF